MQPRLPEREPGPRWGRHPAWWFAAGGALLLASILFPYWRLNLWAPQYPQGLAIDVYVNRMDGDVGELEGLNHYVGLPGFDEGAVAERQIAVAGILGMAGLLAVGLLIRSRWVLIFSLPALTFPLVFLADLQYWLWRYGHNLDPIAPFADAVGEFTPPVLGPAKIAQFKTWAIPHVGLTMAILATACIAIGLWYHRSLYKPGLTPGKAEA
jgi:hypothetical protein